MKILLSAPTNLKTVPMSGFAKNALEKLGHSVEIIPCRESKAGRILKKLGLSKGIDAITRKAILKEKWDLFLAIYGFDISTDTLRLLKEQQIPSACWWLNDPFQFERSIQKSNHFDYYFTNAIGNIAAYKKLGTNAYHLPTACEPSIHKSVTKVAKYACDVCFAGDWNPTREQLVSSLLNLCNIKVFGPWGKKISKDSPIRKVLQDGFFTPQEMVEMFSSAKITLNIHSWFETYNHGTNPRLFEAASCGAFQLTDWKQEMDLIFKEGQSIITYKNLSEVPTLVEKYLKLPQEREMIAKATQNIVLNEHTYIHRMKNLLETVFGDNSNT